MKIRRWCGQGAAIALWLGAGLPPAQAQIATFPNQAVKIIVPLSAGSVTDILARLIGEQLGRIGQQPVIVENRPGIAGTASVAKAAPDGTTLLMTSNGHAVLAQLNRYLAFDPVADFAAVSTVASVPFILIASPTLPVTSMKELIAAAKAKPGQLNIASPGLGTSAHILGELFKQAAGIDVVTIPHKGAPEAHTSVLRGDAHMFFSAVNVGLDYIEAGKVKPLAVAAATRLQALPALPTIAQAGLTGFDYQAWFGVLAPAGTPEPVMDRLAHDIDRVLQLDVIRTAYARQGVTGLVIARGVFEQLLRADTDRLGRLFKELGLGAN